MATMTPDRFDSLKRYVGVRLQQGVPIVDADWNELEDVRKFEVQAFLKWFVRDGVPDGNDGFRIVGAGLTNDFVIGSGISGTPDGLRNVGRCLMDGRDVIIKEDINFTAQPLHTDQPGSADLALKLGVPQIAAMTVPNAAGTVVAYLDVWEWLVTSVEDPGLVLPGLGVETCVRIKREWVVRVRDGALAPSRGDADFLADHSYYALATITRRAGDPNINPDDVAEQREQRLLMPPATLIPDVLGIDPQEYRRGQGRPAISLRAAINALIRGETLATPEMPIAPAPASDDVLGRGTFFDATNGLVTIWSSNRVGAYQIFAARLSLADPDAGFAEPPQQITDGVAHTLPHAVPLDTGEVLVVYQSLTASENEDIHLKRASLADPMTSQAEIPVADAPLMRTRAPFAVPVNGQVVIFWHSVGGTEEKNNTWQFRRFDLATNSFPSDRETLSTYKAREPQDSFDLHAAPDKSGNLWVAFLTDAGTIRTVQVPPGADPTEGYEHASGGRDACPYVMVHPVTQDVWFFWSGSSQIWFRRFVRATNRWDPLINDSPAMVPGAGVWVNQAPAAVTDADGAIWLFWHADRGDAANEDIWYIRRHPVTGAWGEPQQITRAPEDDTNAFVLHNKGTLWLFWKRQFGVNGELFFQRIFTSI
jgi:hypothetical protein